MDKVAFYVAEIYKEAGLGSPIISHLQSVQRGFRDAQLKQSEDAIERIAHKHKMNVMHSEHAMSAAERKINENLRNIESKELHANRPFANNKEQLLKERDTLKANHENLIGKYKEAKDAYKNSLSNQNNFLQNRPKVNVEEANSYADLDMDNYLKKNNLEKYRGKF